MKSALPLPKLDENWPTWAPRFKAALHLHTPPIDHTINEPLPAAPTAELRQQHVQALALMTMYVSDAYVARVDGCADAYTAYHLLKLQFDSRNRAGAMRLHLDLTQLKMTTAETVTSYYNRAEGVVQKLRDIGAEPTDTDFIMYFLNGLTDTFNIQRQIILAADDYLNDKHKIVDLLNRAEAANTKKRDISNPHALMAGGPTSRLPAWALPSSSKPAPARGGRETRTCHYCHKPLTIYHSTTTSLAQHPTLT